MTQAADLLLLRDEGPVRWLTLNRPDRLNAVNEDLAARLLEALRSAAADKECRVAVLTGKGRAFSTGQDLHERRNIAISPVDLGEALARNWHPLLREIRRMDKPVIAAVNGIASGAAVNLALACDIVVAARSATFTQPFVRIGLMPDAGGAFLLPRIIGSARARAFTLLSERIDAETAEQMGFIWKAVPDASFVEEIRAVASRLAQSAPLALAATKRALATSETGAIEQALAHEVESQRALGYSRDYAEGVTAFFEKRHPRFEGS